MAKVFSVGVCHSTLNKYKQHLLAVMSILRLAVCVLILNSLSKDIELNVLLSRD